MLLETSRYALINFTAVPFKISLICWAGRGAPFILNLAQKAQLALAGTILRNALVYAILWRIPWYDSKLRLYQYISPQVETLPVLFRAHLALPPRLIYDSLATIAFAAIAPVSSALHYKIPNPCKWWQSSFVSAKATNSNTENSKRAGMRMMHMTVQLVVVLILISCSGCVVATSRDICSSDADVLKFSVGAVNATVFNDGVFQSDERLVLIDAIAAIRAYERLYLVPFEIGQYPVVFDTGSMKVLIDTGSGPEGFGAPETGNLLSEMKKAGFPPESIDAVILSHGHSDHIGGLLADDGAAAFPNAKLYVPRAEFEFWSTDPLPYPSPELIPPEFGTVEMFAENFLTALKAYEGRVFFLNADAEVFPGFTFVNTSGHTPGHVAVRVASENATVLVIGDTFLSWPAAIQNPEWRIRSDINGGAAVATRYRIFDELATSGELVLAYHLHPSLGRIIRDGADFDWIPAKV